MTEEREQPVEKQKEHQRDEEVHEEHNGWRGIVSEYWEIFSDVIDLKKGLDRYGTILSIRNNIHLRGVNIWLLICAIFIASIGLDKNSVAIIIGGMLISPLMYPILGVGLAIAMNDRVTLLKSIENFSVAILITLVTSTLYFAVTPFGYETIEITSRTKPDIIDVFVGFFGGIAGIVAGSRKNISSAIPGVAIATALLPPICVAGYGLAKLDMVIFGGAFYLFLLNAFFIMIATYLVVKYLKFPVKKHASKKNRRRSRAAMAVTAIIIILPSFYFLRNSIIDIRTENFARAYITDHFESNVNLNVISWEYIDNDSLPMLECTFQIGDKLSEKETDSLQWLLNQHHFHSNTLLKLRQIEASEDEIQELRSKSEDRDVRLTQSEQKLEQMDARINELDIVIGTLEDNLFVVQSDSTRMNRMTDVLKVFYEDLEEVIVSRGFYSDKEGSGDEMLLVLEWDKPLTRTVRDARSRAISSYVGIEFSELDTVIIKHQ